MNLGSPTLRRPPHPSPLPRSQDDEVRRADLPFEFMLNALRLREGFGLQQFNERTKNME